MNPLQSTFMLIAETIVRSGGNLELPAAADIFSQTVAPRASLEDERFCSLARSYCAAMEMFVIAHEAGHIAYKHPLGRKHHTYGVDRNKERIADSFAADALLTSPFREYMGVGHIFVAILFSWVDHAAGAQDETTHPASRERFENALNTNREAADQAAEVFGFTRERLLEFLPPE